MWKKDDVPPTPARPDAFARPEPSPSRAAPADRATIGRSIAIRGDVTGDEDLLIQGRVDGSVDLKEHAITVGSDGEVKASVIGRVVVVEGRVEGDINSDEQVILRGSAWVKGDIAAPRVVLEDGARFQGGIDMGDMADQGRESRAPRRTETRQPEIPTSSPAAAAAPTEKAGSPAGAGIQAGRSGADATAESRT
jgi:cytoskeletal protein CcmA (bactofilin family)